MSNEHEGTIVESETGEETTVANETPLNETNSEVISDDTMGDSETNVSNECNCDDSEAHKDEKKEYEPNEEPAGREDKILEALELINLGIEYTKGTFSEIARKVEHHASEMNKLYQNEVSGRLQRMHADIEKYREREDNRIFDGILIELANLYSRDHEIIDYATDEKLKTRLSYLFEGLSSLLEKYHVEKLVSQPGDKLNTRHCRVIERVPTDCKENHGLVHKSRSIGFYSGNRTIVKENVDIYYFDENSVIDALKNMEDENE